GRNVLRRSELLSTKVDVEVIARRRSQHVSHTTNVRKGDLALGIQRRSFAEASEILFFRLEHHRECDQVRKRSEVIEPRKIPRRNKRRESKFRGVALAGPRQKQPIQPAKQFEQLSAQSRLPVVEPSKAVQRFKIQRVFRIAHSLTLAKNAL